MKEFYDDYTGDKKKTLDKCQNCNSREFLHIHYIVPLDRGGFNRLSNMAVLCDECISSMKRTTVHLDNVRSRQQAVDSLPANIEKRKKEQEKAEFERNIAHALSLYHNKEENGYTIQMILDESGVSKSALYKRLK